MSLLERERELAVLRSRWRAAGEGSGGVIAVRGVAGVGKTALLEQAARDATAAGLVVLWATGSELERELGFGLIRQLFERPLRALSDEERAQLLSGAAGLARRVVLDLADGQAQPEAATLHGLYWLAVELAARTPLLVCVDDAQWADAGSLRALSYLGRRLDGVPLLLVLAARDAEPGSDAALLDQAISEAGSVIVRPSALSQAAVACWLDRVYGRTPDPVFVSSCHTATGGNPLLLRELTADLRAEGLGADAAAASRITGVAPEAIGRSVLTRLARLGPAAVAVAEAVAVLSQDARLDRVAAVADVPVERVAEIADRLIATGLLTDASFAFAHPLLRAAVYDQIPSVRRSLTHSLVAQRLLADGGGPERAAGHLLLAPEAGRDWAVQALRAAAAAATARGAPAAAVRLLRRALVDHAQRDYDLMLELAQAEALAQDPAAVAHATEVCARADTADQRARGAIVAIRALHDQGAGDQMLEVLAAVERDASALGPAVRRELAAGEVMAVVINGCSGLDARLEALGVDALSGETPAERLLLMARATDLVLRARPYRESCAVARRALAHEDLRRTSYPQVPMAAARVFALADAIEQARAVLFTFTDGARARGVAHDVAYGCGQRSEVELRAGRLHEAEADAREAVEVLADHQAWTASLALAHLVEVLLEREPPDVALALITDAPMDVERLPSTWARVRLMRARGRARLFAGDLAGAVADLRSCGAAATEFGDHNPASMPWRSDLALALHALGETAAARALAAEELQLAHRFGAPGATGTTLRTRALLEPGDRLVAGLREAEQVLARTPMRLEHARVLVDLGAALRRAGHRGEARDTLRIGLDTARRRGAHQLADRAREELTAAGARPRRERLTGPDALTASERRVTRLAADGLTNRQIAQALFVTTKTVEMHLAHAYPKLGIKRRDDLATALTPHAEN